MQDKAELESSLEGTYPLLEEIMKANMLQKLNEAKDMSDQKVRELEGSIGLVLQSIRKINTKLQSMSVSTQKVEAKKAPVVLMEDNLTMAKRALMVTKQLCPTGINVQKLEQKAQLEENDLSTFTKLKETLHTTKKL